jgi:MoaA/NifB/PqqE/SkfB family radical SAM enzyme
MNKCKGNRSYEDIKADLIDSVQRCEGVVFTGGEVTIRKDFIELIKCAKRLGYKNIQIQSNARMLSYYDLCKKAVLAGATEFAPALHGYCSKQHDYLTCADGSFRQTKKAIKNMKSLGAHVISNTVVVKPNYKDLPKIANLLINLGVDQYQFAFVHALGNAYKNYDQIVPCMTLAAPFIKKGLQIGINAGKKVMVEAVPHCIMQEYSEYISENFIPDTEIRGIKFQNTDDFREQRVKEGKIKFAQCRKCKYNAVCEGPWKEYPERFGNDEFVPVN